MTTNSNDNPNDIQLNGIEVGGEDPVHLDSKYAGDSADLDEGDVGFDEGIDMRALDDEEGDGDGADTGDTGDGAEGDEDPDAADEGDGDADAENAADAPSDLGEFKADDPENVEAFTKQYYAEGVMNLPVLYAEFEKNFAEGNGRLNAGTEAFLASRGIPKEALELHYDSYNVRVEEAKRTVAAHDAELKSLAGGEDTYKLATKWAMESGTYSNEAAKAFNKVMAGSDLQAKKDAVELLMARYSKANPPKDRDEPLRDATKGRSKPKGSGAKPFADRAEYSAAVKAAGDNMEKLRIVDARAKASGF